MSIRQILQVWEHEFSHPHQAVMLALADHAHEDGTGIRPSINRIAWKTGYSERSVQNIMGQLRDLGILVVTVPATPFTPNEYKFEWSAATPKPAFDEYMALKKGRQGRGANSAPPANDADRGAIAVQQGCSSDAAGVQFSCDRGAVAVQQGCSSDAAGVQFSCDRGAVAVQQGCSPLHPIRQEPIREPSTETKANNVQVGVVKYQRPPDEIDLSELWEQNPGMAKSQIRFLAAGHKRPEMVAHGVGHWWIGPSLNDFDEHLIQACRNRKRKFQQSDSVGDAKTYINNMLKNGDWANFSLRCDEAIALRDRTVLLPVIRAVEQNMADRSPFARSAQEQRESALGLARFKVSQGLTDQALAIAQQFGLARSEIDPMNTEKPSSHALKAV
jgi:hypothetical protein